MKVQDIADKPYRDYVRVYCDDTSRDAVIEALDIIWEHPEGRKKIKASYENKGILEIRDKHFDYFEGKVVGSSYGTLERLEDVLDDTKAYKLEHRIVAQLNPLKKDHDVDGNEYQSSLLSVLAHELYHAADPNISTFAASSAFSKQCELLRLQAELKLKIDEAHIIAYFLPDSIIAIKDSRLPVVALGIYKNSQIAEMLAENDVKNNQEWREAFRNDERITRYVQQIETPAIDFSNRVVAYANKKYDKDEPMMMNDYSSTIAYSRYTSEVMPQGTVSLKIMEIAIAIKKYGGIENYINHIQEEYEKLMQPLRPAPLVRIKYTPQAQVENIEWVGSGLAQNDMAYGAGRC
jgi:hypothetical protein